MYLSWKDEKPEFPVEFPTRLFSEETRVAMGIPTVICNDADQQSAIFKIFSSIQDDLRQANISA